MLGDSRFIRTLRLRNFLSYGEASKVIECNSLNVLIGPNASGKSNLIEAISLLKASPRDIAEPIRRGGGIMDWLWKGNVDTSVANIEATLDFPKGKMPLKHSLAFTMRGQKFELFDEFIENEHPFPTHPAAYFYYHYQRGQPVFNILTRSSDIDGPSKRIQRSLQPEDLEANQSVLSQRKDPDQYPEITYLAERFSKIMLYREWNLGRHTPPRIPQKTDLREDFLEEDASNLALVLNDLEHQANAKQIIVNKLKIFCESYVDYTTRVHGGTIQVFLSERGLEHPIPATRLSDGTIRYLCLLTILCHPSPPPVVCIEEPELGLHPDAIPIIAELLIGASHRTQLFVTTHSDILVSALSEVPESVIVCEKDSGGSVLRRLDQAQLKEWLEKYSLGELWGMGEIGGNQS